MEGLAHQEVIGDLDGAGDVLLAGCRAGEHGGHDVVGLHALDGGRVALAAPATQHHQGPVEVPAPAGGEHGRIEHSLGQHLLN